MKKWNVIRVMVILISLGIISGCKKEKEAGPLETYSEVNNIRQQIKEEGVFFIDGFTQQMSFYDFELGDRIPLCDKPNCEHDSANCNAYLQYGYQSTMGCYRDKIYFFDITDPECPFYQADKNGTNRKVITTMGRSGAYAGGCSIYSKMIFAEECVYLQVRYLKVLDEPVIQEDGTIKSMKDVNQIVSIHLENGETEVLKELGELEGESVALQSFTDGMLIYLQSETVYGIDVETKVCEELHDKGYLDVERAAGKIYYTEEKDDVSYVYTLDIETKETELIFQKQTEGKHIEWDVIGDKLYYCRYLIEEPENRQGGVYLLKEQKEIQLNQEEYKYRPIYETGKWYVTHTEEGLVCIPIEAYENQEWDKVQVIGWM